MNSITTYNPKWKVTVLTPWGYKDISNSVISITTVATIKQCIGQFTIELVPNYDEGSLYDILEPMAYMEVQFKRVNKELTTVMRGFVSVVSKRFDIVNGQPQRTIVVQCENYGKIMRNSYIHYVAGPDPLEALAGSSAEIALYGNYAVDLLTNKTSPSKAITTLFNKLVLPNFENIRRTTINRRGRAGTSGDARSKMVEDASLNVVEFVLDVDEEGVDWKRNVGLDVGFTDPDAGAKEQSVLQFFEYLCGRPWNELFIDDAPDATFLVYRPIPWRDRDGNWIGSTGYKKDGSYGGLTVDYSLYPDGVNAVKTIEPEDLISYEIGRSDNEVFNYFFVNASHSVVGEGYEQFVRSHLDNRNPKFSFDYAAAKNNPMKMSEDEKKNGKIEYNRMELYGFRKLEQVTNWLAIKDSEVAANPDIVKKYYTEAASKDAMTKTGQALAGVLYDGLEHASQLENGSITIKGREDIRPGMYVKMKDERNDAEGHMYYVTDVIHKFVPFGQFITQLGIIRGEGHLFHSMKSEDKVW